MTYRAKSDDNLRKHLDSGPQNATYMGHSIHNELSKLCAAQIRDSILEKCKQARFLTVLTDESAQNHISITEQVSISLHYVDKSETRKVNMREDFLWLCPTWDTTGRTLADLITTMLKE